MKILTTQIISVILSVWSFPALATPIYSIRSNEDVFFYKHSVTNDGLRSWPFLGVNALINKPQPTPSSQVSFSLPTTTLIAQTPLSFRSWEGSWNLAWQYDGKWYESAMTLRADQFGIEGDYELGSLKGTFVNGSFTQVEGEFINTSGTGADCPSGKQGGWFSFNLANNGKHMRGWWDICGKGKRMQWKADKRS
jgi:hypothetical protein